MASVFIEQFDRLVDGVGVLPSLGSRIVAIEAQSESVLLAPGTRFVRLRADADCAVRIGLSNTAADGSELALVADAPADMFAVFPNRVTEAPLYVSAIAAVSFDKAIVDRFGALVTDRGGDFILGR